jgi:hypothetical protein
MTSRSHRKCQRSRQRRDSPETVMLSDSFSATSMRALTPLLLSASMSRRAATAAPPVLSLLLTMSTLIGRDMFYAKIVQASAMKACFQSAECSLSYAKIVQKSDFTKCMESFLGFTFTLIYEQTVAVCLYDINAKSAKAQRPWPRNPFHRDRSLQLRVLAFTSYIMQSPSVAFSAKNARFCRCVRKQLLIYVKNDTILFILHTRNICRSVQSSYLCIVKRLIDCFRLVVIFIVLGF